MYKSFPWGGVLISLIWVWSKGNWVWKWLKKKTVKEDMKYCWKTSLGDRLPSNAALQEGGGKSQEGNSSLHVLLANKKEFLGELHLTQVWFCCSFSCQILLESFCLMKDYSPRLIPVLWALKVNRRCHFQSAMAVLGVISWWRAEGLSHGWCRCCDLKEKGALKNETQEREVRGLNGVDSWRDPNGRGFGIHILTWVHRCWRTGVFLGKTSWDGTKMEILARLDI